MKKYVVSLLLCLAGLLPARGVAASDAQSSQQVHLKFKIALENMNKATCSWYDDAESGELKDSYGFFELWMVMITGLKERQCITILSDDVEWLSNSAMQYTFEAFIDHTKLDSKIVDLFCDIFIKNKYNNEMLCKSLEQEFNAQPRHRSAESKAWGNQAMQELVRRIIAQKDDLSPLDSYYAAGVINGYLNVGQEQTDITIGAYLFDDFGCTVKINEFVCDFAHPVTTQKVEAKVGVTHLFGGNESNQL